MTASSSVILFDPLLVYAPLKPDDKPLRKQTLGLIVGDGFSSQDEHIRIVMPARDFHHEIIVANASSNPGNLVTDDGFSLGRCPQLSRRRQRPRH